MDKKLQQPLQGGDEKSLINDPRYPIVKYVSCILRQYKSKPFERNLLLQKVQDLLPSYLQTTYKDTIQELVKNDTTEYSIEYLMVLIFEKKKRTGFGMDDLFLFTDSSSSTSKTLSEWFQYAYNYFILKTYVCKVPDWCSINKESRPRGQINTIKRSLFNHLKSWYLDQKSSSSSSSVPLIIYGPPGCGKTCIVKYMCEEVFRVPTIYLNLQSCDRYHTIYGSDQVWKNSSLGILAKSFLSMGYNNGVIVIENIHLYNNETMYSLQSLLSNPREFVDLYLAPLHIDLSKVCFIFTSDEPQKQETSLQQLQQQQMPVSLNQYTTQISFEPYSIKDLVEIVRLRCRKKKKRKVNALDIEYIYANHLQNHFPAIISITKLIGIFDAYLSSSSPVDDFFHEYFYGKKTIPFCNGISMTVPTLDKRRKNFVSGNGKIFITANGDIIRS